MERPEVSSGDAELAVFRALHTWDRKPSVISYNRSNNSHRVLNTFPTVSRASRAFLT